MTPVWLKAMRTFFGVALVLALAWSAWGSGVDRLPAGSSPWIAQTQKQRGGLTGHAWVAIPLPNRGTATTRESALFHIPPRDDAGMGPAGTLKLAARLNGLPLAVAAWGDDVDLAFAPTAAVEEASGLQRRVVRLTVSQTLAGAWEYGPEAGPSAEPALPGDGTLMGLAGGPRGPLALLRRDAEHGGWMLLGLGQDEWGEVALPSEGAGVAGLSQWVWGTVLTGADGPTLLMQARPGEPVMVWRGAWMGAGTGDGPPTPMVEWSPRAMAVADWAELGDAAEWCWLAADGLVAAVGAAGEQMSVWLIEPGESGWARRVGGLGVIDAPSAVVSLDGLARIAAVWEATVPTPGEVVEPTAEPILSTERRAAPKFMMREVSLVSGRTFFDDSAAREGLLSSRDFQLLTLILGGLMVAVLLFVLRSESQDALPIPAGFALASPGRRLGAALVDLAVPMVLACIAFGIGPEELFGWGVLTGRGGGGASLQPLAVAWGCGLLLGVLADATGGRSLGKRLLGCVVVGYRRRRLAEGQAPAEGESGERRELGPLEPVMPNLRQAFLRNIVKWCIPPLTLLVLFDQNMRHPGDVLAGTLVLVEEDAAGGEGM